MNVAPIRSNLQCRGTRGRVDFCRYVLKRVAAHGAPSGLGRETLDREPCLIVGQASPGSETER
eukprot:scaffold8520_cov248-Pinguiococcus_pyrenoidosus.AAC.3